MRIAVDLDKTIFSCDSVAYDIITQLVGQKKPKNSLRFNVVNYEESIKNNVLTKPIRVLNSDYYYEVEDSVKYINQWYLNGHKIVLLSTRPNLSVLKKTLLVLLEEYEVPFTLLVIGCSNKAKFCKKYKIDILIDDSKINCEEAYKRGVNSIFYNPEGSPGVRVERTSQGARLFRANSWIDINILVGKTAQAQIERS